MEISCSNGFALNFESFPCFIKLADRIGRFQFRRTETTNNRPISRERPEELDQAFSGIRCPLCSWRPLRSSVWCCVSSDFRNFTMADVLPHGTHLKPAASVPGARTNGNGPAACAAKSFLCTKIGTEKVVKLAVSCNFVNFSG